MKKKVLMKMSGLLLAAVLVVSSGAAQFVLAASGQEAADVQEEEKMIVYLDGKSGSDKNSGEDSEHAVKSFERAAELTGDYGVIRICGTVTIKGESTWELPNGVSVRRAEDFEGSLVKVEAKGKLILDNVRIYAEDITGDGKVEGAVEREKVTVPATLTVKDPVALSEIPLTKCEGDGVFVWEDEDFVPTEYETACTVVFYPYDSNAVDYSGEKGWDEDRSAVIRQITLVVEALEPVQDEDGEETAQDPAVTEEAQDPSAEQPSTGAQEPVTDTQQPSAGAQEPVTDTQQPPAGAQQPATDTQQSQTGAQTPEQPASGQETSAGETGKTEPSGSDVSQEPAAPDASADADADGEQQDSVSSVLQGMGSGILGSNDLTADSTQQESPLQTVQAQIMALSDTVDSQEAVLAVVEVTKAYEALTDLQKELFSDDAAARLLSLQELAGVYNRQRDGVTIEGDIPWYVQLQVAHSNDKNDTSVLIAYNVDTFITPYDLSLWDLMRDEEYHLDGLEVKITMPSPDMSLYKQLVIVHYLQDGTVEYLTPVDNGDGTITFLTTSFSPYNIAGSKVLVGSTDKVYSSTSSTSGTKTSNTTSSGSSKVKKNSGSSAATSKANSAKTSTSTSISRNPNTNDTTGSVVVYVVVAAAALAAVICLLVIGQKRKRSAQK